VLLPRLDSKIAASVLLHEREDRGGEGCMWGVLVSMHGGWVMGFL